MATALKTLAQGRDAVDRLERFVPDGLRNLGDPQTALPRIAKDSTLTSQIEAVLSTIPTTHNLYHADARHRIAGVAESGCQKSDLLFPIYAGVDRALKAAQA